MTTAEQRLLQQRLAPSGITLTGKDWPRKATYYKPDGEPMPNLPADPASMSRYLDRGFTLAPPKKTEHPVAVVEQVVAVQETIEIPVAHNPLLCECGFKAKTMAGLAAHQRKHTKEKS